MFLFIALAFFFSSPTAFATCNDTHESLAKLLFGRKFPRSHREKNVSLNFEKTPIGVLTWEEFKTALAKIPAGHVFSSDEEFARFRSKFWTFSQRKSEKVHLAVDFKLRVRDPVTKKIKNVFLSLYDFEGVMGRHTELVLMAHESFGEKIEFYKDYKLTTLNFDRIGSHVVVIGKNANSDAVKFLSMGPRDWFREEDLKIKFGKGPLSNREPQTLTLPKVE